MLLSGQYCPHLHGSLLNVGDGSEMRTITAARNMAVYLFLKLELHERMWGCHSEQGIGI